MNRQVALQALSSVPMRSITVASIASWAISVGIQAEAAVISATAQGSLTPPTELFPETVTNGDFLIAPAGASPGEITGDRRNEGTNWTLDFTNDPNFSDFSTSKPLTSARLTLTLSTCCDISTDAVRILGFPVINTDLITELPIPETNTIDFDLLDFYTSNQILEALFPTGMLPFRYFDDAIVSFSKLELSNENTQSVPDSVSSFGLMAIGVVGLFWKRQSTPI